MVSPESASSSTPPRIGTEGRDGSVRATHATESAKSSRLTRNVGSVISIDDLFQAGRESALRLRGGWSCTCGWTAGREAVASMHLHESNRSLRQLAHGLL